MIDTLDAQLGQPIETTQGDRARQLRAEVQQMHLARGRAAASSGSSRSHRESRLVETRTNDQLIGSKADASAVSRRSYELMAHAEQRGTPALNVKGDAIDQDVQSPALRRVATGAAEGLRAKKCPT